MVIDGTCIVGVCKYRLNLSKGCAINQYYLKAGVGKPYQRKQTPSNNTVWWRID